MRGDDIKAFREARGWSQSDFATWLNDTLGRRYDKQRVSKWETNADSMPRAAVEIVIKELLNQPPEPARPAMTVCLANRKGGVGKTMLSVNIAEALGAAGQRVLLVDADPQANATIHCGLDPLALSKEGRILYFPLRQSYMEPGTEIDLARCVVAPARCSFEVLPSSLRLEDAESELGTKQYPDSRLRELLNLVRPKYDFIIIDTPPHYGQLTRNALHAADVVIVPCQTEMLSVAGVDHLLENIDFTQRMGNPSLDVLGIVPTMHNAQATEHRSALQDIHTQFGARMRVFKPIPRRIFYAQTAAAGFPALVEDPNVSGSETIRDVVDDLLRRRGGFAPAPAVLSAKTTLAEDAIHG